MKAIALIITYVAMVCSATPASAQQQPPERKPTEEEVVESITTTHARNVERSRG
jgi:hypothetical protein